MAYSSSNQTVSKWTSKKQQDYHKSDWIISFHPKRYLFQNIEHRNDGKTNKVLDILRDVIETHIFVYMQAK